MSKQIFIDNQHELDLVYFEREQELIKVKDEVREVNQLFKDVAELIHHQSDANDRISDHIRSSRDNVKDAYGSIVKAEKEQKKTETFYMYIAGGVAGAVTIGSAIIGAIFLL